jgi:Smg protein
MFEVLAFVYENYWPGDGCPEPAHLERKLSAVGFESEEIHNALAWLNDLNLATQNLDSDQIRFTTLPACQQPQPLAQTAHSMRVYSVAEREHLGPQSLGFVCFLENSGVLPPHLREIVMDRAMAAPGDPVPLEDLKIIVLLVYWRLGIEADALVVDELCDDTRQRHSVAH